MQVFATFSPKQLLAQGRKIHFQIAEDEDVCDRDTVGV
jgi:hypothetical protein